MNKGKKILGTMVVDLHEAKFYGRVRNVVLSLEEKKAIAVILPGKSWLHPTVWIDFRFISGRGKDVLTVASLKEAVSTKKVKDFKKYLDKDIRNFWGVMVISTKGKLVGYVEDLFIGIPGGMIEGIELSNGVLGDIFSGRGFMPGDRIVSLSMECIVVEED